MDLDPDVCYRALTARDPRFDGLFFVGVTTTRIYCRPICPARTPGRDRCRFFPSAAAAERARFRPCLRCRPELAPGNAPVDAVGRMARLAAVRIGAGVMNGDGGLETLAAELGVSSRHLRRVLQQELGVSPVELAQTHRLLLAKQLLTETALPIVDVAFASGFASVRRFNGLFRSRYRLTPSDLRRTNGKEASNETIRLTLAYRPPLAWEVMLHFLAARAVTSVEAVVGRSYLRTVELDTHRGWVKVEPAVGRHALVIEVPTSLAVALPRLLARLRNLFDLDARPDAIAQHLGRDAHLGHGVASNPGLRVPGAFDGFELALRAVLGQQVSMRAATTLAGRLAETFGQPLDTPFAALARLSPSPGRIADARLDELTSLGLVRARAECLRELARAVRDKGLSLEAGADAASGIERLTALPGIGAWTAHYIAMRAMRWPDAFPHSDLGLRKALGGLPSREVLRLAEAWRPWRAYAAMHLWTGSRVGIAHH
ncbi:MAG TPA: AlkA N-terminal domain-containing protein [Pirellulales bacterium]|jgi:AraC family transcriptional regulator of adaptative response / DNA-3-methyladenine glycosylase II|nr:AlkA N-terminal domain-containing protein [Pirellulales bacterium]